MNVHVEGQSKGLTSQKGTIDRHEESITRLEGTVSQLEGTVAQLEADKVWWAGEYGGGNGREGECGKGGMRGAGTAVETSGSDHHFCILVAMAHILCLTLCLL